MNATTLPMASNDVPYQFLLFHDGFNTSLHQSFFREGQNTEFCCVR